MTQQLILIANNGQDIKETNYWDSEMARRDLAFLSANAGAIRLLVLDEMEEMLGEMPAGLYVLIKKSTIAPNSVDVVFVDRSDEPFTVVLDKRAQIEHSGILIPGQNIPFTVWTRGGKQLTRPCVVR